MKIKKNKAGTGSSSMRENWTMTVSSRVHDKVEINL